jgi:heme-degrading monooxygenase HmoA
MYASTLLINVNPDQVDHASQVWSAITRDVLSKEPGSRGAYLLNPPGTGKLKVVGFWEAEADARAYEASGRLAQHYAAFFALSDGTPPEREVFNVVGNVFP